MLYKYSQSSDDFSMTTRLLMLSDPCSGDAFNEITACEVR